MGGEELSAKSDDLCFLIVSQLWLPLVSLLLLSPSNLPSLLWSCFSCHEGSLPPEVLVDEDKEEEVTLSAQLRELVETKQAESIQ